jgi:histone-lysine N-methyltransferase SETMAR
LGYAKVCARWVPRSLTDDHKTVRKEVCSDLLSRYKADGESFFSWIVTGGETWIHNFEPETKRQSMEWNHPTSHPRKNNFKVTASAGKVMVTVSFWDAEEVFLVDIMPRGQVINSDMYIQTLKNLQKRLRRVRPYKNVAEILIQHDNARPHTSLKTGSIHKTRIDCPSPPTL